MKFPSGKRRECGHKLCHENYFSALCHAIGLSEKESQKDRERLVIYPCSYCGFLHLGHQSKSVTKAKTAEIPVPPVCKPASQENKPRQGHDLAWQLARSKRRIARAEIAIASFTNPHPRTVRRYAESLRDMRKHLAALEVQAQFAYFSSTDSSNGSAAELSQSQLSY